MGLASFNRMRMMQESKDNIPAKETINIDDLSWDEIKALAKEKGIKIFGSKREELIAALKEMK